MSQEHARMPAEHRLYRRGPLFSSIPRATEQDREHDNQVDRMVAALHPRRRRFARRDVDQCVVTPRDVSPGQGVAIARPRGRCTPAIATRTVGRVFRLSEVGSLHSVTTARCLSCGGELPPRKPGPGRPGLYCSKPCRKQAEFEVKRIDRHIEHAEAELQWCHRAAKGQEFAPPTVVDLPGRLVWWTDELARLRARQRELLAAPEGE